MAATAERLLRMMALNAESVREDGILDLFARLVDTKEPAQLRLRHAGNTWKAA